MGTSHATRTADYAQLRRAMRAVHEHAAGLDPSLGDHDGSLLGDSPEVADD
jgi:glutathione S-transferase